MGVGHSNAQPKEVYIEADIKRDPNRYKPAIDPITKKAAKFCDVDGKCSCAADEVYWEFPDGIKQTGKTDEMCDMTRDGSWSKALYPGDIYGTCSKLDPKRDCPVFASGLQAKRVEAFYGRGRAACKCIYDVSEVAKDCKTATEWLEAKRASYGDSPFDAMYYDTDVMAELCAKPGLSEACNAAVGRELCSNLIACKACSAWATSDDDRLVPEYSASRNVSDNLIDKWCDPSAHMVDDPSCKCKHKQGDKDFIHVQTLAKAPPGCWYIPCVDNHLDEYLTPSTDRRAAILGKCPDSICINEIWLEGQAVIDVKDITMICGDDPKPDPDPKPTPPSPSPAGKIALALAVAGVAGVFVYVVLKNKKKT